MKHSSYLTDIPDFLIGLGINPSPVRVLVARSIASSATPVTALQIENDLSTVDRSSITRTLSLFTSKGAVHAIDDGTGATKFELCRHCMTDYGSAGGIHYDMHPHFHCLRCGMTYCLDECRVPPVNLPEGFRTQTVNYVVKGVCASCNDTES